MEEEGEFGERENINNLYILRTLLLEVEERKKKMAFLGPTQLMKGP